MLTDLQSISINDGLMTKYYKEVCVIGKKNIIILIEFISYHSLSRLGPYLMGHFYPLLVLLSLVFVTIEYQRISNLVHISSYHVRGNSSGVIKSNKRNIHVNMLTYFRMTMRLHRKSTLHDD